METTPPEKTSIWRRPWKSPKQLAIWGGLLFTGVFLVLVVIAALAPGMPQGPELVGFAGAGALIVCAVLLVTLPLLRWVCCWRNFRRVLFAAACLATLVAMAYGIENWRGKHAWRKHRATWEAKGENFDLKALIPSPVPDDQNFAMAPLLKPIMDFDRSPTGVVWRDTNALARLEQMSPELIPDRGTNHHLVRGNLEKGTFADMTLCAEFYRGNTNYPQASDQAAPAERMLTALGKFAPELNSLREAAAARPLSRFPIHYEEQPSWGILLPHLARIKGLTQLANVRALAYLEAGQTDEAFRDLMLGFRLSDSIKAEPLLIDHLVRIASLLIDLQTVREGLVRHSWTDSQLAEIQRTLATADLLAECKHAFEGERALSTSGLEFLSTQGGRSVLDILDDGGRNGGSSPPVRVFPSGWFYQNMLGISEHFQDFTLPAIDSKARRIDTKLIAAGMERVQKSRTGPYNIFVKMLLPAVERAAIKSARAQTFCDAARVACALERSRIAEGKLPERLDSVVPKFLASVPTDIMDGKPLRYQLKPDGGYVLYSVGENLTDEGGKIVFRETGKDPGVDPAKGDWAWVMPASR
jgi:hypothetical protein